MSERKRVLDRSINVDFYNLFEGKRIDDAIADLMRIQDENTRLDFLDAKFRCEYYGDGGGFDFMLDVYRDETDKEYKTRLAKEQKLRDALLARKQKLSKRKKLQKLKKEAAEREEYERLKAKFG